MNRLRGGLLAGVAVVLAGALVGGFLLLRDGDAGRRPVRDHLAVPPTIVRPNVLVDVSGAVLEEFSGDCVSSRLSYLCLRVADELRAAGPQWLVRDGLTIRTTVDQRLQRAAQQAIDRRVGPDDVPLAVQAMVVPGTGEIRAMATNRPLVVKEASLPFPQGGTAMVYTLAAAFEAGLRDEDGFPYASEYRAASSQAFRNCKGDAVAEPAFTVRNAEDNDDDRGAFTTLRSGTLAAENTFFLRLTERVGLCESVTMARQLGLERGDGLPLMEFETFPLGVNEVDPVTAAGTYATLAARGKQCEPMAVAEIRAGPTVLASFAPRCRQVLDPPVADAVTDVLSDALEGGPLRGLGRDAAGMEGTVDAFRAAWYVGYTPALASAVALGSPGKEGLRQKLADVTLGGKRHRYVTGLSIPGPIWKDSMAAALEGLPRAAFPEVDTQRYGGCRDLCRK